MAGERIDLDALIGAWRGAFEVAESALRAASRDGDLSGNELRARYRGLSDERAATLHVLEGFALDRHTRPLLVRLVASSREAKALLGLPSDAEACVFNVDGVLVASATIHADAWKQMFDRFISSRVDRTGGTFTPFSRRLDYPRYIHGKSREDAVRTFLASRGISLPEGGPDDDPEAETVRGLANGKSRALLRRLEEPGISAFEGARLYLELAHDAKLRCAVVSGSTTTRTLLEARAASLVDECVDENGARQHLRRKPAPTCCSPHATASASSPGGRPSSRRPRTVSRRGRAGASSSLSP
jgi:beta-phosphoglucomutase-like phosphatase (HAD superfamily)